MHIIPRIAAAVAILAMLGTVAHAKEWTKVRIGTEGAYPPFNESLPDGTLAGFDIDIAKALCEKMKVECEFVTQDWDGMIPALQAGKYDAIIASMSITDERKQQVAFTDKYYQTPPGIVVPKDSELKEATPEALEGVTIGAQSSTTHANYAEAKIPGADVKLYPTADEYKLDLTNGRLDAAIDDIVVLEEWVKSDAGACCKVLGALPPDVVINGEGAGIAIRKEDTDLVEMFNKAIEEIRADGTYKRINDKYFGFDVYGS